MNEKKASFAGSWYPESSRECEKEIKKFIKHKSKVLKGNFKGSIVPHAGWYFSGSIASRTIAAMQSEKIDTVIIFGIHMRPDSKPCIMIGDAWNTPFGNLKINKDFAHFIAEKENLKKETCFSFPIENTIELQLPFIKFFFPEVSIVPIGVPPASIAVNIGESTVKVAKKFGINIILIGSTDLTHYGPDFGFIPKGLGEKAYNWVKQENDKKAVNAILEMNPLKIIEQSFENHNLCCSGAVAATVAGAKKMNAVKGIKLDYGSSYEKKSENSFVGYTGILFGT
ncbi:MAG: AmmeMemoRadiSam system protein B [Desulfobacteraceae bacterium 4572_130]|nr:MAG: AmmeMemoRadiSam system protein B [Desulfobacteraceae bacterium 4572_130]